MNYTHLREAERYDIYEQRKEGASLTEIAKMLRRSKSTISREVARNSGQRGYRLHQANELASIREKKDAVESVSAQRHGGPAKSF